jgi:hypothetical protein
MQSEVYDDCAFEQQQQDEAELFWSVSDTLYAIDHYGVKSFFDALWMNLHVSRKNDVKKYFKELRYEEVINGT